MQQTVLVVSLLTVDAVGAAYKRLLCFYGSQKSVQRTRNRNWQRNLIDNFFAGYARVPLQFSPAASPPNNQSLFIGFLHYKDFQWSWRWLMRRCSSTALRRFRLVNSYVAALTADTTRTIKLGLNNSINSPLFGMSRYGLWCYCIPFNQSSPWSIVISSNLQWPWN